MTVQMIRFEVKEDSVPAVEASLAKIVAGLDEQRPDGVHYAVGKLADGVTFVGILGFPDGTDNPLLALPAARDYVESLPGWLVGDRPMPEPLSIVADHQVFG